MFVPLEFDLLNRIPATTDCSVPDGAGFTTEILDSQVQIVALRPIKAYIAHTGLSFWGLTHNPSCLARYMHMAKKTKKKAAKKKAAKKSVSKKMTKPTAKKTSPKKKPVVKAQKSSTTVKKTKKAKTRAAQEIQTKPETTAVLTATPVAAELVPTT